MNKRLRVFIAHCLSGIGVVAMLYGLASIILTLTSEVNIGWQTLIYGGILYLMGQLSLQLHNFGSNISSLASTLFYVTQHIRKENANSQESYEEANSEESNEEDIFADFPNNPGLRVSGNP